MKTGKEKVKTTDSIDSGEAGGQKKPKRRVALWLGGGTRDLDMGWGRGPRRLKAHELVSWFFSRDGI